MIIQFQCDVACPSRMNVGSSCVDGEPVTGKPAPAFDTSGEVVWKANFLSGEAYYELMGAQFKCARSSQLVGLYCSPR